MSVNISSVSGGVVAPVAVPVKLASSLPANPSSSTGNLDPSVTPAKPVYVPIAPSKPVDFSQQVSAQQEALQKALEELNQQAAKSKMSVGFSLDKASGMQYVQVTNANSGEVMMQFPSNKMLDIAASIEHLKGMLYNKKA